MTETTEEDRKKDEKHFEVGGIYKSFEEGIDYLEVQSTLIFETDDVETEGNHPLNDMKKKATKVVVVQIICET